MDAISYAFGTNHFQNDADLQAVLRHFWPDSLDKWPELIQFGQFSGTDVYEAVYHIDHDAPPVLIAHDLDGNRIDRIRLSPVEKQILANTAWIMAPPYQGQGWPYHYALLYLLGDPGLGCVLTITGQTAYALHKYAAGAIPEVAKITADLLSGRAWGATWMTESQGGSDLGANETVAQQDGEIWRLTGDKYFASGAGLTDYALTTARPLGQKPGPKGLALFLLPRLNHQGDLNYHVRRLKDKSATRAVPSGEVELTHSEAYLIGRAEEGIYYTLETLTVSRLANAVVAMATGKKAHLEVMERVQRRHSFGRVLQDHPLIRHDLTDLAVRSAAGLALAFYGVGKFDQAWDERPPYTGRYHLARLVTHLAKNRTADHAASMTATAMELFGGLGFLEEYAVARWHREALITPIWEGPSNIQALDFLESVQRHKAHRGLLEEMVPLLEQAHTPAANQALETLEKTFHHLESVTNREAQWYSKQDLSSVADAVQVALLYDLAQDQGERYAKLAELYEIRFMAHRDYPYWADEDPDIWGGQDHA
ncbi:MAG: acyl-CoA dehydrogenase family protein [Firmicutes bacterium]|jgi:alkylation response protein AidB-like acyl-CoA dehydrogenase|uniref:Acyl-CoA dehydrogenase n=1 Tax=Sulfobacillus benefaciens TaxID=453960 RepID=A0A2T2X4H6_9FIRM|nr:acyl-CoA dehydrogenase family protein [Bacillota bacterium]MCL5013716.1 acyl-CoA dehydrogenase family protein [Bacillota bacterium]PSR29392.1 MAG: acyl-CoA dehydrogenase [Sulfobacillus benefaciens]